MNTDDEIRKWISQAFRVPSELFENPESSQVSAMREARTLNQQTIMETVNALRTEMKAIPAPLHIVINPADMLQILHGIRRAGFSIGRYRDHGVKRSIFAVSKNVKVLAYVYISLIQPVGTYCKFDVPDAE